MSCDSSFYDEPFSINFTKFKFGFDVNAVGTYKN